MVEFLDYRCGYCKRAQPDVKALLNQDGNIRYIIKEFPILGEQSTLASRFALSVKITEGDDAYFAVHNALMESNSQVTPGSLRRLARDSGLDADAIMDGMENPTIDMMLQANYQLGQAMQVTGTPSFVLGETMMRGYAPLDAMVQIVAEQRANSDG
jgi:protein-disulfide isomerase